MNEKFTKGPWEIEDLIVKPSDKWERFLDELFDSVPVDSECEEAEGIDKCRYLIVTPDVFGTGDPDNKGYECICKYARNCPRLFNDECDAGRIAMKVFNGH